MVEILGFPFLGVVKSEPDGKVGLRSKIQIKSELVSGWDRHSSLDSSALSTPVASV